MKKLLLALVVVLGCDKARTDRDISLEEQKKARAAEVEAAKAAQAASEANDQVLQLMKQLDELDAKIQKAVEAVVAAQNDAERAAASDTLKQLQTQKKDLENKVATAKATAAKAERMKGVTISKECLDNPLAKGCQ